jgi:hypothetical protein
MHAFSYPRPEPTWLVLQRQYSQPVEWPAAQTYSAPVAQPTMSTGTFLAGAATVGSLLVLFGKSSKTEKDIAMQVFRVAAPVLLVKLFQIQ